MKGWVSEFRELVDLPPAGLQAWLSYRDSITERAKQQFAQVAVELLEEGWQLPLLDEAHSVNQSSEEPAFIREIFMICDDEPGWYARTVIARATYEHYQTEFDNLGVTPIGTLLHQQKDVIRSAFQFLCLQPEAALHQRITQFSSEYATLPLWARRSVFHMRGYPLLLQEVFLPGLVDKL